MKNLLLLLSFLLLPQGAHALPSTTQIVNNGVASRQVYSNEVDVLVLDFTVRPAQDDTLTALTVENIGQPPAGVRIGSVSLWQDSSEAGFQGWEQDKLVATSSDRDGEQWVFSSLSQSVRSSGTRFFVTANIGSVQNRTYPVQWSIPQLIDSKGNNTYDTGDTGLFLASGQSGPINSAITNNEVLYLSAFIGYQAPPQSAITSPLSGATVNGASPVVISGKARARSGGSPDKVQIRIGSPATVTTQPWTTVTSTEVQFSAWEHRWAPKTAGQYRIETRANDANGVAEDPHGITVNVEIAQAPVAPPPPSPPYANSLIKTAAEAAVYYVGPNGKRYAFPNSKIYFSWYQDFSWVKTVTGSELASVPFGGAVTYRPGGRLVKLQTDPKVYAVSKGGVLRWVSDEFTAVKLFGSGWAALVDDLSDAFFSHYSVGELLTESTFYNSVDQQEGSKTIGQDKNL